MKAILKYSLYRRPKATNELEPAGFLPKDSVIDVVEMIGGKNIDGISIWANANDGFYYWGGGIEFLSGESGFSWAQLSNATQIAFLNSMVSDEEYGLNKKVIGYLGCAVGYKNDNKAEGLALTVFVDKKIETKVLGRTILYKGIVIPVDVKEIEKIKHQSYVPGGIKPIRPDRDSPMQMGGSISRLNSASKGTRSLKLKKGNNKYLMTCFHVLLNEFRNQGTFSNETGNQLFAAFPAGNPSTDPTIKKEMIVDGKYTMDYDFAIVQLSDPDILKNAFDNRNFKGFHTSISIQDLLDKDLFMAGTMSVLQKGKVLETKAVIFVDDVRMRFENVIVTEKISLPGDSGAPVIDESDRVVGIIIAGNEKDRSFILPIYNIVFQQNYFLDH